MVVEVYLVLKEADTFFLSLNAKVKIASPIGANSISKYSKFISSSRRKQKCRH